MSIRGDINASFDSCVKSDDRFLDHKNMILAGISHRLYLGGVVKLSRPVLPDAPWQPGTCS